MKKHSLKHGEQLYHSCRVQVYFGGAASYVGVANEEIATDNEVKDDIESFNILDLCKVNSYSYDNTFYQEDLSNISPFLQEVGWLKVLCILIITCRLLKDIILNG